MLNGLNHITFAVSNLDVSFDFYVNILGMKPHVKWENGAYLSLGDLWFCLSCDEVKPSLDYTHIAFDVSKSNFPKLKEEIIKASVKQWKQNKSEGDSLYFRSR